MWLVLEWLLKLMNDVEPGTLMWNHVYLGWTRFKGLNWYRAADAATATAADLNQSQLSFGLMVWCELFSLRFVMQSEIHLEWFYHFNMVRYAKRTSANSLAHRFNQLQGVLICSYTRLNWMVFFQYVSCFSTTPNVDNKPEYQSFIAWKSLIESWQIIWYIAFSYCGLLSYAEFASSAFHRIAMIEDYTFNFRKYSKYKRISVFQR